MTHGILYTAVEKYENVHQALLSVLYARKYNPGISCTIYTCEQGPAFGERAAQADPRLAASLDAIVPRPHRPVRNGNEYMRPRLENWRATPYERTLALDTDTLICGDLSGVFALLPRFDVCMAQGVRQIRRLRRAQAEGKIRPDIPLEVGGVQGGVVLFGSSDRAKSWVELVIRKYAQKAYFDDQVSMLEAMWEMPELRWRTLPKGCNFHGEVDLAYSSDVHKFADHAPLIMHYVLEKSGDKWDGSKAERIWAAYEERARLAAEYHKRKWHGWPY